MDDQSTRVCARLLQPPLDALPELGALREALEAPLPVRLPVVNWLPGKFNDDLALRWLEPESQSRALELSLRLSGCLVWPWVPGKEQHTLLAVEALLISPLMALDEFAPPDLRLDLIKQRDTADSSSGMTSLSKRGKPQRPDLQLRSSDGMRLLFKGEDKAAELKDAVEDLRKKTAVWSALVYGKLPYLLCYAAAGPRVRLYAVSRGGSQQPQAISRVYDMSSLTDRVPLLCLAVQLHRLLRVVFTSLPECLLRLDEELSHQHLRADGTVAWTRTVTLESATSAVLKSVCSWAAFCEDLGTSLDVADAAYKCPAPLGGLLRAVMGPSLEADKYTVRSVPLGLTGEQAHPRNEHDLRAAPHGLLHGLAALHAAGIVHRDVRWENVARSEHFKYFLIDLESCAWEGGAPACSLGCWRSQTLEAAPDGTARYTSASDIHLLGLLLDSVVHKLQPRLSTAGRDFLGRLLKDDASERLSATAALEHAWIGCLGAACQEAGARLLPGGHANEDWPAVE